MSVNSKDSGAIAANISNDLPTSRITSQSITALVLHFYVLTITTCKQIIT